MPASRKYKKLKVSKVGKKALTQKLSKMRKMRQMKKLKANGGGMHFINYKNLKINGEYYLTQIKEKISSILSKNDENPKALLIGMIMLDKLDDIKQDFIIKKFTQLLVFNKDNNFEIDLEKPETQRQYILLIFRYTNTSVLTGREVEIYFTIKLDINNGDNIFGTNTNTDLKSKTSVGFDYKDLRFNKDYNKILIEGANDVIYEASSLVAMISVYSFIHKKLLDSIDTIFDINDVNDIKIHSKISRQTTSRPIVLVFSKPDNTFFKLTIRDYNDDKIFSKV